MEDHVLNTEDHPTSQAFSQWAAKALGAGICPPGKAGRICFGERPQNDPSVQIPKDRNNLR